MEIMEFPSNHDSCMCPTYTVNAQAFILLRNIITLRNNKKNYKGEMDCTFSKCLNKLDLYTKF